MRLEDLQPGTQRALLEGAGMPKPKKQSATSIAADLFEFQLRSHRFAGWVREHRFAAAYPGHWPIDPTNRTKARQWSLDFANVELQIAVEIEGLRVQNIGGKVVCTGRHSTPDGYRNDCRKYNAANELGWHVLRADQNMVKSGEAIATVERMLARRGISRGQS
jgi:hypothetical protein